jgi:hypothetical protein
MAALIAGLSGAASAQTTDAGYWDALTPSMASVPRTDMRLKGHVPPSTARAEAKKK